MGESNKKHVVFAAEDGTLRTAIKPARPVTNLCVYVAKDGSLTGCGQKEEKEPWRHVKKDYSLMVFAQDMTWWSQREKQWKPMPGKAGTLDAAHMCMLVRILAEPASRGDAEELCGALVDQETDVGMLKSLIDGAAIKHENMLGKPAERFKGKRQDTPTALPTKAQEEAIKAKMEELCDWAQDDYFKVKVLYRTVDSLVPGKAMEQMKAVAEECLANNKGNPRMPHLVSTLRYLQHYAAKLDGKNEDAACAGCNICQNVLERWECNRKRKE